MADGNAGTSNVTPQNCLSDSDVCVRKELPLPQIEEIKQEPANIA